MHHLLARLFLLAALLVSAAPTTANELTPFASDGCSAFPDGTPSQRQLWQACCVAHDRAYWRGGSYAERLAADRTLQVCVEETGSAALAELMYHGVRLGGSPFWPTPFRWGFGWPYPRGYRSLSDEERAAVQRQEGRTASSGVPLR